MDLIKSFLSVLLPIPKSIRGNVPKRFAISWRNKWMLKQADTVVTYVTHPSAGAWELERSVMKQGKRVIKLTKK